MNKTKTLRRLVATLAIFMAVLLVPGKALAVDYEVWVQGIQITDDNKADVLGDGTVSFDPTTNTLTLNNATVNGAHFPGESANPAAGIYSKVDLTIEMVGENTVTGMDGSGYSWGIGVPGIPPEPENSLIFRGTGTLTVTAGGGEFSVGIYAKGITVESGTITTSGETAWWTSAGVFSLGGPLTMEGGTLIATGGEGNYFSSGAVLYETTLNMKGGTLITTSGEASSGYASAGLVLEATNFSMTGGTLEAVGGTGEGNNIGLYNEWGSTATITGGTLTLRGSEGGTNIPLNLDDYIDPIVTVDDNKEGTSPEAWNTTTPLNDGSFRFVKIQPSQATSATVTFDPNGGIGTMEDIDTFVGLKVTLPENGFTPKDGRVFDGWLVGTEDKQPGDEITVTGDTVVKAQWALTGVGYAVNLNVTKDGTTWSEDAPVITIGTTPETAVENGEQLPNGTYTVYEDGVDTGRTVTVNNGVAPRELNLKYYTLTVIGGTGIASTEGSGTYLVGQEVTISATVESGYLWTGWKSSNSILMRSSNLRVYTFNMPAGTLTMTGTARRR